jgi:hypothetical protein
MLEEPGVVIRQVVEAFASNIAGNALIYGKSIGRRSLNLIGVRLGKKELNWHPLFAT